MADWIIRRGIPVVLATGYLAAVAISGGNPTTLFAAFLDVLQSTILELVPQIL